MSDMNWNYALKSNGLWWKVETIPAVDALTSRGKSDDDELAAYAKSSSVRVTIYDRNAPSLFCIFYDFHPMSAAHTLSLPMLLRACFVGYQRHPRLASVRNEWRKHLCVTPVMIEPGRMDNIGELMHTAIRKLMDDSNSVILHRAIDFMCETALKEGSDQTQWSRVCELSRSEIQLKIDEAMLRRGAPLLRSEVGRALEVAWNSVARDILDNLHSSSARVRYSRHPQDAEYKQFIAMSFKMLVEKMDLHDWAHGIAGYIVEDLPLEPVTS